MSKTLVIIPHFNKLALLKECLHHLESNKDVSFDIMVVDNGSNDGSSEYLFKKTNEDKTFHSILLNENKGFAKAVNLGLKYSIDNNYDYSILLNNDAYVEDDFVKNLVLAIKKNNKIFAVSSLMLSYHEKDLVDSFGDYYNILGWSFQGHLREDYNYIDNDEKPFSACAGAAIYSNSVLKRIGLFDESFFAYLEDIDISYRAKLYGYDIRTCKNAICYHLGSATTGSKYNEFKVRISARNNIYLLYKNMPYIQMLLNIFPLFIGHVVKFIFFIHKGFGLDYFFGFVEGFRNLKYIKKNDFTKIELFRYINIEIELIKNTFLYIKNFLIRHV